MATFTIMVHGKLQWIERLIPSMSPALACAVSWIRALPADVAEGKWPIPGGSGMVAQIIQYDTLAVDEVKVESHRSMVDLQYTIRGAEGIGWYPDESVAAKGLFIEEKDVQFYDWKMPETILLQRPGFFSIFVPEDIHAPKIRLAESERVFKLVVKIPLEAYGIGTAST